MSNDAKNAKPATTIASKVRENLEKAGDKESNKNDETSKSTAGPAQSSNLDASQERGQTGTDDQGAPKSEDKNRRAEDMALIASVESRIPRPVRGVEVSAVRDGYRRAGRSWSRTPQFLEQDDLTEEQWQQLLNDRSIIMRSAQRSAATSEE